MKNNFSFFLDYYCNAENYSGEALKSFVIW